MPGSAVTFETFRADDFFARWFIEAPVDLAVGAAHTMFASPCLNSVERPTQ